MFFLYPMWDNESQRIGKQKCTPVGYALHCIAELLGFVGLLVLFAVSGYLAYRGIAGSFRASLVRLLGVPFGLGLVSQVLYQYSWALASRKGFQYDRERREASWTDRGVRHTYRWASGQDGTTAAAAAPAQEPDRPPEV